MTSVLRGCAVLVIASLAGCSSTADVAHAGTGSSAPAAPSDAALSQADAAAAPATISYAAALRSADWARWPGAPPDLREADLLRDLGLRKSATTRRDGRLSRRDAVIVDAHDLRYWLRDGRVVLIQVTGQLGTTAPDALRAQLGAADREGPGRFLQSGATTTEYVYAGRGIALTVAESYDKPASFAPRLAAVQLFARTDLRTFALELGGNDRSGPSH